MTSGRPARAGSAERPGAGNRLLAALSRRDAAVLLPQLQPFRLVYGAALLEPGGADGTVVFPDTGVVRVSTEVGGPVAGLVGREGVVNLHALFGGSGSPYSVTVQVGGEARAAPARALRPLVNGGIGFRDILLRTAAAHLADFAATAACNAGHPLRGRTARWLLEMRDRAGPGFSLTQDELASMAGARRPTMTVVLQRMRTEGLVRAARGRIAVADAAALEDLACPCRQCSLFARKDLMVAP